MICVCHLTSVHARHDTRIFLKEAKSLAAAGYSVCLVVADGQGDEQREGVTILDAGPRATNRLRRMHQTVDRVYRKALSTNARVFHVHDPELMPAAMKLKRLGNLTVLDVHEDVPKQVLSKHYIPTWIALPVSKTLAFFERYTARRLDAIVCATPSIRRKFAGCNPLTVEVNNYPMVAEFDRDHEVVVDRQSGEQPSVCYIGGIDTIRGIEQVVEAIGRTQSGARLKIAGEFARTSVAAAVNRLSGWHRVDHVGWLRRERLTALLRQSVAGIVTFLPVPNHIDSQPNKLFEYMGAGLPVIASDFPLWREIVEGNDCGLCVDPTDPTAIANAIDYLVANPEASKRMGVNGRRAVEERYNWRSEEQKLVELYSNLLH